jgi:hypothetical protein
VIALWARSYWRYDHLFFPGPRRIASMNGWLTFDENFIVNGSIPASEDEWGVVKLRSISGNVVPSGVGRYFPHWLLAVIMGLLAGVPWLRWRFSLRTLLIATTFIAAVLGLIVYFAKK